MASFSVIFPKYLMEITKIYVNSNQLLHDLKSLLHGGDFLPLKISETLLGSRQGRRKQHKKLKKEFNLCQTHSYKPQSGAPAGLKSMTGSLSLVWKFLVFSAFMLLGKLSSTVLWEVPGDTWSCAECVHEIEASQGWGCLRSLVWGHSNHLKDVSSVP